MSYVVWVYRSTNQKTPWIRKSRGEFPTIELAQKFIKRNPLAEGEYSEILPTDVDDPEAYLQEREAVESVTRCDLCKDEFKGPRYIGLDGSRGRLLVCGSCKDKHPWRYLENAATGVVLVNTGVAT